MKKIILLYSILSIFSCLIYSQYSLPFDEINKTHIEKGTEGILGAQCVGGLIYDDNTFENGYGWGPNFGIGKYVMLMTPTSYPFTINQVCVALSRFPSETSLNFTFDIEIYDTTGTGGSPGNLLASIPNQTVTVIPTWPTVEWYDFTGLTGIPAIISGSVYVGISFDPQPVENRRKYIGGDESATTTQRSGWGYIQSAWAPITSYFSQYKTIGIRCSGSQTYSVSGTVLYSDNNQPVTSGKVKAIKYDSLLNKITAIDSAQIQPNGTYVIYNLPPIPMDFMAFEDDELDYVPTYYDTTIYWKHAITLIPNQNLNNIDIKVKRINNSGNSIRHISGYLRSGTDIKGLSQAIIYAKIGSQFKNYDITRSNGYFCVDSLQDGRYSLVIDRMGYLPYTIKVNVIGSNVDNLNITLIRYTGLTNISNELPLNYTLSNYPNPFNPSTNILFDIVKSGNVKLSIYNLLGEEIRVLVNNNLIAGKYKIAFDASSLASGVYFYKLETENFVQTRKMVLLK